MAVGIIELNDAGVRVSNADSRDADYSESPGVAVVARKDLLLGEAAMRQSRLRPVETNTLFWHRLSTDALPQQNNRYRHHADLAYSHLLALHQTIPECNEVVFALPGSFTRQQMSLLLGIVSQCPFEAVGLVDSAVAACAAHVKAATLVHVDLQLHQCVFTQMRADGQLQRTDIDVLRHCGFFALSEQWAKVIADQFIDQARFDPLHSATSEQSLYDQLPEWLQQCRSSGEVILEISGNSIKLTREQLVTAVMPIYRQIIAKAEQLAQPQSQLLIGDRLAALPGLTDAFNEGLAQGAESLAASAVMQGIHNHIDVIKTGTEQLSYIQALPIASAPAEQSAGAEAAIPQPNKEKPQGKRASHLLVGDTAHPLADTSLYVDLQNQRIGSDPGAINAHCSIRKQSDGITLLPHDGAAIKVNHGKANEQLASDNCLLHCGDSVSIAGSNAAPITLIEVLEANGS